VAEARVVDIAVNAFGLENERPAIDYAKAQKWLEPAKIGETLRPGWLTLTSAGKAVAASG